ncbi:hypothetical protein K435DRAFT_794414 [Dendrothele bispora CBS 962.96]|uniref:Uncharacterized protein n=1 Tax=Dendrothele bispora (strain CBS 962.96) TaxID=1314807 RepID=A0A4S8MC52_DENBC|nr:hypothetical protein K435DRAFT_794414 [Dendrothele bispora CBS 962.96]
MREEGVKKWDPVKFRPEEGFLSLDDAGGLSEDELEVKGLQGMKRPPYLKQNTSMDANMAISFGAGQKQWLKGRNDGFDLDNLKIGYSYVLQRAHNLRADLPFLVGFNLALRGLINGGDRSWNGNCVVKCKSHWERDEKWNSGWIRAMY